MTCGTWLCRCSSASATSMHHDSASLPLYTRLPIISLATILLSDPPLQSSSTRKSTRLSLPPSSLSRAPVMPQPSKLMTFSQLPSAPSSLISRRMSFRSSNRTPRMGRSDLTATLRGSPPPAGSSFMWHTSPNCPLPNLALKVNCSQSMRDRASSSSAAMRSSSSSCDVASLSICWKNTSTDRSASGVGDRGGVLGESAPSKASGGRSSAGVGLLRPTACGTTESRRSDDGGSLADCG
mmetsp:Transcript_16739/g.52019  ORF Transcript_16739/g.52019 Transcript_16739/m.52019 type:complete len:238 (-) Transcript_16739:134-847(-)